MSRPSAGGLTIPPLDEKLLMRNPDYDAVRKTISILEKHQAQALADIERLHNMRAEALANPMQFFEKVKSKTLPPIPEKKRVIALPYVDFYKYGAMPYDPATLSGVKPEPNGEDVPDLGPTTSTADSDSVSDATATPHASKRRIKQEGENSPGTTPMTPMTPVTPQPLYMTPGASIAPVPFFAPPMSINLPIGSMSRMDAPVIRGRPKGGDKNESFNQLWSEEENALFERLLILHPSEPVMADRWRKISASMAAEGFTRHHRQVASRAQKYFEKAEKNASTKEEMDQLKQTKPPGRKRKRGQGFTHRRQRQANIGGLANAPPPGVSMDDLSEDVDVSEEEEESDAELRDNPEYQELIREKKRRKLAERRQREVGIDASSIHQGFSCDGCQMDPIIGKRFTCKSCPADHPVDLCEGCYAQNVFSNDIHDRSHIYDEVRVAIDDGTVANYLDPNYLPS